ncbi:MAG TPA: hypothetical protein VHW00_20905 [Thermoanaerobaculia bacterium]|nr:hypothetical protein [Thermoanaerobaculia bacterium]
MAIVVATLAIAGAREDSATIDEPAHIASGLIKLTQGRLAFYRAQAPLMNVLDAAPLAIAGYRVPANLPQRAWIAGHELLYRSGYDARRMLLLARLPTIALLLALAFAVSRFVFVVTSNPAAATIAFALTGFCPNLLAHGRLATVDLGVACFLFIAAALFLRLLREPSTSIAIAGGLATACAIASKTSGALIVVFFLALAIVRSRDAMKAKRALLVAAATAIASFALLYMLLARSFDPTLAFREYLAAIDIVRGLYARGYTLPQFLLGEFSRTGWPHYHVVAFLLKTTLPALLLTILTLVAAVKRRRFETLALLAFAMLFLAVSSFSKLNLGLRHILPLYPFLYAAIAITLADASKKIAVPALLVAWHVVAALAAYPSYLSYFNPLIGSTRNADAFLIDSNLDWGQDLHRLARWSGAQPIRVHYFGGGDVAYEFGTRAQVWPAPRPETLPKGLFAVSKHIYRITFMPGTRETYDEYLRRSHATYVTTVGGSMDVYLVGSR